MLDPVFRDTLIAANLAEIEATDLRRCLRETHEQIIGTKMLWLSEREAHLGFIQRLRQFRQITEGEVNTFHKQNSDLAQNVMKDIREYRRVYGDDPKTGG